MENIIVGLILFVVGVIVGSCFWVAMNDKTFDKDRRNG